MKIERIELENYNLGGDPKIMIIGNIHISAIRRNGKDCLTVTALNRGDFVVVQPISGNAVTLIATNDIRD